MTLSFSQLGKLGRLANQMFQIASTIGIARKNGFAPVFPAWEYDRYFEEPIPHGTMNKNQIAENGFMYNDFVLKESADVVGYLQSKKYWEKNEDDILHQFKFKKSFLDYFLTRSAFGKVFEKEVIAIHIRRGDYVDNPNYYNLPAKYYIGALKKFFPGSNKMNILVFSDDMPYVKSIIPWAENIVFVSDNSAIDDLGLMSLCNHFIIANSSFSWWGAYLGSKISNGIVVRPAQHFDGPLKKQNPDTSDYYLSEWKVYDHEFDGSGTNTNLFDAKEEFPIDGSAKFINPLDNNINGNPPVPFVEKKVKKEKVVKPATIKKAKNAKKA